MKKVLKVLIMFLIAISFYVVEVNAAETTLDGFNYTYEVVNNEYVKITGITGTFGSEVVLDIPSEIESLPVKEIGENVQSGQVYDNYISLKTLVIPETVEVIAQNAFSSIAKTEMYVYSRTIEMDYSNIYFLQNGYTLCFNTTVYGYDGSGVKDAVDGLNALNASGTQVEATYISLDDLQLEQFEIMGYIGEFNEDKTMAYVNEVVDKTISELTISESISNNGTLIPVRFTANSLNDLNNLKTLIITNGSTIEDVDFSNVVLTEIIIKDTEMSVELNNLSKEVIIYVI